MYIFTNVLSLFLTWRKKITMEYFVMIQYFGVLLLACLTGTSINFHSLDTTQALQTVLCRYLKTFRRIRRTRGIWGERRGANSDERERGM